MVKNITFIGPPVATTWKTVDKKRNSNVNKAEAKLYSKYIITTYHIVNVLPVVECNELKGCEHWPQQIVKAGVAKIGIVPHMRQADPTGRTRPKLVIE
jgi:hypothetical protein